MRDLLLRIGIVFMLLLMGVLAALADATPILSDLNKLRLISASQAVELDKLRLERDQRQLDDVIKDVTIPGYDLNNQLIYIPKQKDPDAK